MARIVLRSADEIAKKWGEVTPARATYYEAGVREPTKDWANEASAAAPTYKSAVQNPMIDKLYIGGIKKAGTDKWKRKAVSVGVARYGPGVAAAIEDYKAGFAPYADELSRVELPPKKPRGSSENIERVKRIADSLHKKRLAMMAVSTTV